MATYRYLGQIGQGNTLKAIQANIIGEDPGELPAKTHSVQSVYLEY